MNKLSKTGVTAKELLDLPGSPDLQAAVHLAETDGLRYGVTPQAIAEAGSVLERFAVDPAPTADQIFRWLMPAMAGVAKAPTKQQALDRASAVAFACADLPASLFSVEALRRGMMRWQYLPTPAEVRDVVAPDYLARKRVLWAVAHARPAAPAGRLEERTPEELAHAHSVAEAAKAALAGMRKPEPAAREKAA